MQARETSNCLVSGEVALIANCRFSGRLYLVADGFEEGIAPACDEGCDIEDAADIRAPAPDVALAAPVTRVADVRRNTGKAYYDATIELSRFRQARQQHGRDGLADARGDAQRAASAPSCSQELCGRSPQNAKQPPDVARRVGIARHGQALRLGCYVADDVLPARRQFGQPPSAGIDGPCRPETQADPFAQARAHPPGRSWPDVPWPTHASNSQTKICELLPEITIPLPGRGSASPKRIRQAVGLPFCSVRWQKPTGL